MRVKRFWQSLKDSAALWVNPVPCREERRRNKKLNLKSLKVTSAVRG